MESADKCAVGHRSIGGMRTTANRMKIYLGLIVLICALLWVPMRAQSPHPALVRVTLVPLDSSIPNRGPYDCTEIRAFPDQFYAYLPNGDILWIDMREIPYATIAEPSPVSGL